MKAEEIIGTFGGVGLLRPAPGTWGSLVALPFAWGLYHMGGLLLFLGAILVVFAAGFWATIQITTGNGDPDPSRVVVDEVAGQWIALFPVLYGASFAGADLLRLWPGWVVAFFAFRLFDIWKPWIIGWADRRHDPLGVMLDDALAGVFAALVVILLGALYHVFLT
ncbi:phosphatidylglycerophosphatase, putative [Pseudooceanicola batsensis HTCC2597]|uniref:Phosphatidylglycerophosphatase A n=1 Tax=Pseudooceanicola batsensis (strain ATCC BAA-863 / DSM 15984 / KCTC 12145 / HTCC2597) TaxID=252305 RepID=A3TXL1_PSEBH|nr:phosphatidylglycerophosphatase A [Pseudooceanicola batsensis]EAQ03571.1 phosphatidylglycerophosphatase, putative [Pseudooceanicola batsensis HTCC2597]